MSEEKGFLHFTSQNMFFYFSSKAPSPHQFLLLCGHLRLRDRLSRRRGRERGRQAIGLIHGFGLSRHRTKRGRGRRAAPKTQQVIECKTSHLLFVFSFHFPQQEAQAIERAAPEQRRSFRRFRGSRGWEEKEQVEPGEEVDKLWKK